MAPEEVYDLLILVDATYSMTSYLKSLQTSLPQIIEISTLTDCFSRIGLLAYRDYCDKQLLEWSEWLSPSVENDQSDLIIKSNVQPDLVKIAKKLTPLGGGDGPEATKTGLARAYELMRADATTIILLYTDAPPHTHSNGSMTDRDSNMGPEQRALTEETSYGGFGPHFADWVSAARWLSRREGEKKAQVFTILEGNMPFDHAGYYTYLSTMTDGATFYLSDSRPSNISKVTVEVLLAWMGAEKPGAVTNVELPAYLTDYISTKGMENLRDEMDEKGTAFFLADRKSSNIRHGGGNVDIVPLTSETFKRYLPKKQTPVLDFAKRYFVDERYKKMAVEHLKKIIAEDVAVISINPVFGSLWRALCNDRENPARDEVITAFGLQIDRIQNAEEKAHMKVWLEESYDYTAEVTEAIESVPVSQRFPCVCLDPTLTFTHDTESNEDEEDKSITLFRRDELLEIGRSCDYKILRRLGRVLTRLTYINSAEEMPAHIAAASETDIPRIPMALASKQFKRRFWKILLHIVVPGTMLAARPAALLAALSLRLGVKPLQEAADQEMLLWQDRWNNLEIPETWNTSCLLLLLDADKAYQERNQEEETVLVVSESCERPAKRQCLEFGLLTPQKASDESGKRVETLLKPEDRELFDRLVGYKLLEHNLETTLIARIGWTPQKTSASVGPTTICRECNYPRSVTIMGTNGKCGLCLVPFESTGDTPERAAELRQLYVSARVTKEDDQDTPAIWVECNLKNCRAQYVVYHPEALNVKSKCYYCRDIGPGGIPKTAAPVIECSECMNRVIYPTEYRPAAMDILTFKCFACTSGRKTVVEIETTAKKLSKENTTSWLLENADQKISEPFNNRSLFYTISQAGVEQFCDKVKLFPQLTNGLTFNGKLVRNTPDLIKTLQSWISRRRSESGICSLCFSNKRKADVLLACGRTGCHQRICKDCLQGWYGLNGPGRIINTSALSCPFCRRDPTAKTLAKYGMGIHAVADLRDAVRDRGEWISAWCCQCGHAKRYIERVCAAGAPEDVTNFTCEACSANKDGVTMKECPGCGTMTEKMWGCDHITCTACGAHWCYFCSGKFDERTIYSHMSTEHGGYYGGQEHEYEDGYDTDATDY